MSLILDALNRSESERRELESVPGLHADHGAPEVTEAPAWRRFLWPGLVVVLAILAVVPWLGGDKEAAAPATPEPAAPQPAALELAAPQPAAPATAAVNPALAPAPAVTDGPVVEIPAGSMAEPGAGAPGTDGGEIAAQPVTKAQPDAPAADSAVASLYDKPSTVVGQSRPATDPTRPQPVVLPERSVSAAPAPEIQEPASEQLDIEALTRAAEAGMAERRVAREPLVEHEAPFIVDLRQSVKDEIPSIFYNSHNWASNPSQRSVVLNGETRRAGDQVKPGLRLVEILEDSIVLDFRGTEFRLRSLNSWVNL